MCEVTLLGDHKFTIKQQKYKVSDEIKKGEARDLFGPSSSPAPSSTEPTLCSNSSLTITSTTQTTSLSRLTRS